MNAEASPRAVYARWLRLRATVRAMRSRLVAAEHAQAVAVRRSDDPLAANLARQLTDARAALDGTAADLDATIARAGRQLRALDAQTVENLVVAARARRMATSERRSG